ncbi:MAG: glycosyltransferase family 4 protein [Lachnospiraceae bacterium]|nr:glycosyltransferase family 4 protein [Lachnospiraceae bacterium]
MNKQILMVMPVMKGGGAERVAALLMNEFHKCGHHAEFLLTSSTADEVVRRDLDDEIPLILLQEQISNKVKIIDIWEKVVRLYASFFSRIFEKMKKPVPSHFAYLSFMSQYGKEVRQLRTLMKNNPNIIVITFLQPSIPMVVLAARGLPNKIIISERGDPERLMKKRYGKKFIEKYYDRVNAAVFQTPEALATYPACVSKNGVVISNPVKHDLPAVYHGKRNKNITTFCRISRQKNLPMLIEAFALLHKEHPDYRLRIFGNALNEDDRKVKEHIENQLKQLNLTDCVERLPFSATIHEEIIYDAMYVNSSDYEGISNAMLEAMAIGMPVVCTDCPIGGAHATIQNEVNGMLVPVGDAKAMYLAMKKIVEDESFAETLSHNAAKIRETLSLNNIAKKWMELL